jgi:hypothetical protein
MGGPSSNKKGADPKDLLYGGCLQTAEALTLGLPLEVWKTRMGSVRTEGTLEALRNIYRDGGVSRFWAGWQPKGVESFLKGGVLLFAKDGIVRGLKSLGVGDVAAGFAGGFGGGAAQVVVLGPCTYLVTASVTGGPSFSMSKLIAETYAKRGVMGFYPGGVALTLRQGSNWASRQGLTDLSRSIIRTLYGDKHRKLSAGEEVVAGCVGGALSVWNQPFEVLRIEAQRAAAKGDKALGFMETAKMIVRENGVKGLFRGVTPRIFLGMWQTMFMVSIPYIVMSKASKPDKPDRAPQQETDDMDVEISSTPDVSTSPAH